MVKVAPRARREDKHHGRTQEPLRARRQHAVSRPATIVLQRQPQPPTDTTRERAAVRDAGPAGSAHDGWLPARRAPARRPAPSSRKSPHGDFHSTMGVPVDHRVPEAIRRPCPSPAPAWPSEPTKPTKTAMRRSAEALDAENKTLVRARTRLRRREGESPRDPQAPRPGWRDWSRPGRPPARSPAIGPISCRRVEDQPSEDRVSCACASVAIASS